MRIIADKLETIHRDANFRARIPARLLEGEGLTTRNRIICRITEEFFAAALTLRCELHRDHLGRYTVTPRTIFDPDRCHSVTGAYRFPLWPSRFDPK
jgi:hypothetical protein